MKDQDKKTAATRETKKSGEKFHTKYGVELSQSYKGDVEKLLIPGPDHPLYDKTAPTTFDELRVQEIDRTGKMSDPIEVWTDPDRGLLWVVDGRGRRLDVTEVNRRRALDGREPVKPLIINFAGDEKEAVGRIRVMNYHRRVSKPSDMAIDIEVLRKKGYSWEECASRLHVTVDGAESWARRLLPLAFCIDEVRAAFDAGEFPRTQAHLFGGRAVDGSEALGKEEQLGLLEQKRGEKQARKSEPKQKQLAPKHRERVSKALLNGASAKLSAADKVIAEGVAAGLALAAGDGKALDRWPEVAAIAVAAMAKKEAPPAGEDLPPPKLNGETPSDYRSE
ncbi:MAG TPA: hypothetical protein VFI56_09140 [Vicinamibacterales bacterium]|nr:hypothetical protein [Vicinamibacterales bacterium]